MPNPPILTDEERAAPHFDAQQWAFQHGVCPYHSKKHQFAGRSYCRLCREERADLVAHAWDGVIFEE